MKNLLLALFILIPFCAEAGTQAVTLDSNYNVINTVPNTSTPIPTMTLNPATTLNVGALTVTTGTLVVGSTGNGFTVDTNGNVAFNGTIISLQNGQFLVDGSGNLYSPVSGQILSDGINVYCRLGTGVGGIGTDLSTYNFRIDSAGNVFSIGSFTIQGGFESDGTLINSDGAGNLAVVSIAGDGSNLTGSANGLTTGEAIGPETTIADGDVVTVMSGTFTDGGALGSNAFTSTAYAPLASPALTGTPTAPTATASTSTTQIATTAYVRNNIVRASGTLSSGTATVTVTSGAHPWVQDTGSSITNVGSLQVTVSGSTATVRSTNVLDASTFDLFYVTP